MRRMLRYLAYRFQHRAMDAELADELEAHRAMKQDALERDGLSSEDARAASHPALGNITLAREDAREDLAFTIVGVTARAFTGTDSARVDVWMPLATVPLLRPDDRWVRNVLHQPKSCCLGLSARLSPGVTREQAQSELTLLDRQYRGPAATPQDGVLVRGTQFMGKPRDAAQGVFAPLFGGVLLVLLLACANVANLLIARGAARRREIAIRLALGASRTRVVRQLLTESAVLALLGGIAGIVMAAWLPAWILNLVSPTWSLQIAPDAGVLAFALTIASLSTLLFGLVPALHATRTTMSRVLSEGIPPGGRLWFRNGLLAVQVCAATVLLLSAGLLVRAVHEANTRSLGYSLQGLSVVTFEAPQRGFDPARSRAASLQLAADLAHLEASGALALTSTAPLGSGNIKGSFRVAGSTQDENNAVYEVSPRYFELLGIPIVAGRPFSDADAPRAAIVVDESLARQFWTVESAIGQRLVVDPADGGWNSAGTPEIIGVARNASMAGIGDTSLVIYQPIAGRALPQVVVPSSNRAAMDDVTAAAARADARLRARVAPLNENLAPRVRASRIGAVLAGSLGALALLLATIGMFGVFAYWVQQRTREIGVRMALGAGGPRIVSLVLRSCLWAVALGAVAGAGAALVSSRLLSSYLFGLSPFDPPAYAAAIALLGASAALATYLPARRATRIDPVIALRCE